jgi:hypothetical protein
MARKERTEATNEFRKPANISPDRAKTRSFEVIQIVVAGFREGE